MSEQKTTWRAYWAAAGLVAAATSTAWLCRGHLAAPDSVMLFMLVIGVAASLFGRRPSLFASALSVLAYDIFFVPPFFRLTVDDERHLLTFVMMFAVGLVMSSLTARIRSQGHEARARERRTAALYAMSRALAAAPDEAHAAALIVEHITASTGAAGSLFLVDAAGGLRDVAKSGVLTEIPANVLDAARWATERRRPTGAGTPFFSDLAVVCIPLVTDTEAVGVVALTPSVDTPMDEAQRDFVEAIAQQAALAIARARAVESARTAALRAQSEEMRSSLLSAVSHDLRTPLAVITGAATTLRVQSAFADAHHVDLVETICEEAEQLQRLVRNLLDMTRIQSGRASLRREWVPVEDVVCSALERVDQQLAQRAVRTEFPTHLPLWSADPLLLEQVLVTFSRTRQSTRRLRPRSRSLPERTKRRCGSTWRIRAPGARWQRGAHIREVLPGAAHRRGRSGTRPRDLSGHHGSPRRNNHRRLPHWRRSSLQAHAAGSAWGAVDSQRFGGRVADGIEARVTLADPVVLVVEDEPQMRRFFRASLGSHGFAVVEAGTGSDAIAVLTSRNPDVVLLDLGLPDEDGVAWTAKVREWSKVPIIVVSARGRDDDKVAALDAGADDYLTKPFSVTELLARMRVALRHRDSGMAPSAAIVEIGPLRVDLARREVLIEGREVRLTPIEYRLLTVLARHAGKVLTHTQLLKEVWGVGYANQTHYLRVYMAQLRRKIEADPARPKLLATEPGVGYRLRDRV